MIKTSRLLLVVTALVLLPVEFLCAASSLETQGEVLQGLLIVTVCGNLVPLAFAWWRPRAALAGLLFIFLLVVPYQLLLLNRLVRINNEVVRIVDSRLRLQAAGVRLPLTLDDHVFQDPSVRDYIYRYTVTGDFDEFSIYYFVVQPGITHSYDSKHGWGYYPD